MLSGCATYRAGVALPGTDTPVEALAARGPGRLVWIGLGDPAKEECERLAATLHLDADTARLLSEPSPRATMMVDGDTTVLRAGVATYDTVQDLVEIGSLTILVCPDLLVTITRHVGTSLRELRRNLEASGAIAEGPWSVIHRSIEMIVAGYGEVLTSLRADVEQLERQAFTSGPVPGDITQRIYRLKREAIDFRQGAAALIDPLDDLADGFPATMGVDGQQWATTRDHLSRVADRSLVVSDLLGGILTAYQTDVALRQNEDMRRISAWVAIAAVPTMLAGVYGMNFDHMPELSSPLGYPIVLAVMALVCIGLWVLFRRNDWL